MLPPRSKEEVVQEYRVHSIQEATLRVIARKGMTAATIQEIADEAGVAKGTIYLYFRDRDELIEKTFETAIAQFIARMDAVIAEDIPFDRKIRAIVAAKIAFFRENREFFRLYMAHRMPEGPSPAARRKHQESRPEYRERVRKFADVLKGVMDRGEIREVDPYRLALFIMEGTTAVILERLTEESSPSEEADVDFLTGLVLDGIRKRS